MRANVFARLTAFGMAGLAALLFLSLLPAQAAGPTPKGKTYGKVYLPMGDVSFADAVVSFVPGNPKSYPELSRPETALGSPDYTNPSNTDAQDRAHPTFVTLGCGGVLTLKFTDNAIVDVPGPDIWVFEIGGAVEPEQIEISLDGKSWLNAGAIGGATASLDIAKIAESGRRYPYIRLTDLKSDCGGTTPGADVDAVAAIGTAVTITLKAGVLFDTGKSALKPGAGADLDAALAKLKDYAAADVTIEGHTDNVGGGAANQKLLLARAEAVKAYLAAKLPGRGLKTAGFGATRPVADNKTDAGRALNRRVEIVLTGKAGP